MKHTYGIVLAALNGACAVAAGAYGAHSEFINDASRIMFNTSVQFQMWHALALLGVGCLLRVQNGASNKFYILSSLLFIIGIILFCGSLYLYGLTGERLFSGSAPAGGLCLIAGWLTLGVAALISHKKPDS